MSAETNKAPRWRWSVNLCHACTRGYHAACAVGRCPCSGDCLPCPDGCNARCRHNGQPVKVAGEESEP